MTFFKRIIHQVKERLNRSDAPKYLSGKSRAVKHERDRQRYLSSKSKKESL